MFLSFKTRLFAENITTMTFDHVAYDIITTTSVGESQTSRVVFVFFLIQESSFT